MTPDPSILAAVRAANSPRMFSVAGICVTAAYIETMHRERDALLSLARTQRRLSWGYRRLALDYQSEGNLDGYRRTGAEARRLWREAVAHLQAAKARNF
jgi:hypothetical protein